MTEAFAAALEIDTLFAHEVIKRVCSDFDICKLNFDDVNFNHSTSTQYYLPGCRRSIDLVIDIKPKNSEFESFTIGFENKWDSPQGNEQIKNYQAEVSYLIYLTKPTIETPHEIKEFLNCRHWTWTGVAKILKITIESQTTENEKTWITNQFFDWLEEEGMAEMEFKLKDLASISDYFRIGGKIDACLQLFKTEAVKINPAKKRALKWTSPSPLLSNKIWRSYAVIYDTFELCLIVGICNDNEDEDEITADILIEINPRRTKQKQKIMSYFEKILGNLKGLGFNLVNNPDDWTLLIAYVPLTQFFRDTNQVRFEDVVAWWIKRLKAIHDNGIIDELTAICAKCKD